MVEVQIGKHKLQALLDSGADKSYIGNNLYEKYSDLNLVIIPSVQDSVVQLADKSYTTSKGSVELQIVLENRLFQINCNILPNLCVDLVLGMDSLNHMGLILNLSDGTWYFQDVPEIEYSFLSSQNGIEKGHTINELYTLLSNSQQEMLDSFLDRKLPLFDAVSGKTKNVAHIIDTGESRPIKQRYYPVSPILQKIMHNEVDKMLKEGVIEPSESPWSSPVVMVKKPQNEYRFCIDFRKINEITKRDSYPLPYIDAILNKLKDAKYISTIDLKNGYWQVPLEETSKEKTAFTVPGKGLYQFTVMPFGIHNAPATFQRLMDSVLHDYMGEKVFCYLDDIICISSTFQEHLDLLDKIFGKLREAGLKINVEKSHFCRTETKYLGHVITPMGVTVDPDKVSSIVNYPAPRNVKQLRSFLGLVSWYRRFIPSFSTVSTPLTNLLRKNILWEWSEQCRDAFETLKSRLIQSPILTCPDYTKPLILQTDASFSGIGAVLVQNYEGEDKVIAYASRSLSQAERKYSVTEKELLSILWAIKKFRPYIEGYHFTIITDHFALKWINNLKNPSGRLARWGLQLQEYSFSVIHRRGALHKVPDALSRIPETTALVEEKLNLVTHLNFDWDQVQDTWYLHRKKQVQENPDKWPDWKLEGNKLFHYRLDQLGKVLEDSVDHWKLVIPLELQDRVIFENHDNPMAGHLGILKTFLRVAQTCFWPKMFNSIAKYVKNCQICQLHKVDQNLPAGQMGHRRSEKPWSMVTSDILGPYPRSRKGNKYVIVFQDYFTKWVECQPMRSATARTVLEAFHRLVLRWGMPNYLLCDNGPQYISKLLRQISDVYKISLQYTPNYTPHANPTERVNRVLKTMMSCYVQKRQVDWDMYLDEFCHSMNTAVHSSTGYTPAYLNLGHELRSPSCLDEKSVKPFLRTLPNVWVAKINGLRDIHKLVCHNLENAYKKQKSHYDLRHRPLEFNVGDMVFKTNYVQSSAVRQFSSHLAPKYVGPFRIVKKLSPRVYTLENLRGKSIGNWHSKDLKLAPAS